jgi:hypothetical protein
LTSQAGSDEDDEKPDLGRARHTSVCHYWSA